MYQAIVFLPLIGALIAGLFGTKLFRNMGSDAEVYGEHQLMRPRASTATMITTATMTARPGPCI